MNWETCVSLGKYRKVDEKSTGDVAFDRELRLIDSTFEVAAFNIKYEF